MTTTTEYRDEIRKYINSALLQYTYRLPEAPTAKTADKYLDPLIQQELRKAGFQVDDKDRNYQLLKPGVAVWRDRNGNIVPTQSRREIDIVVYKEGTLAALIEVEDSLNSLSLNWKQKKGNQKYDVQSIDRSPDGSFFYSYHSLERMATACREHSMSVPMFLVVGCIRKNPRMDDEGVLQPRLKNLGVELLYKKTR